MTRWTLLLLLALLVGCQRAAPYDDRPVKDSPRVGPESKPKLQPLDEGMHWANLGRESARGQTPIVFVHWSKPDEWGKLKAFWNEEPGGPVRIKVPLGLDDPKGHIPEHSILTRERWELGRRLFFNSSLLGTGQSCSSCHKPTEAFADTGKKTSGGDLNAPSLVNSVYLRSMFWDGRATHLEEAMQATLEDERRPVLPFRHSWPGVIGRLRADKAFTAAFEKAFGEAPNQDTAGQALAGYMRTLLAGDSLADRTERAAKGPVLAAHYEALLDDKAMSDLGKKGFAKGIIAADLSRGHALFHGQALCHRCHPSGNGYYSDHGFHNVDVDAARLDAEKHKRGRFNVAPLGEKSRWSMGAWKTPTLRGLRRTAPYFHNGQEDSLLEAVRHHVRPRAPAETLNIFLSPIVADKNGNFRDFGLRDDDIKAITLFLHALDGGAVDASVGTPAK